MTIEEKLIIEDHISPIKSDLTINNNIAYETRYWSEKIKQEKFTQELLEEEENG